MASYGNRVLVKCKSMAGEMLSLSELDNAQEMMAKQVIDLP